MYKAEQKTANEHAFSDLKCTVHHEGWRMVKRDFETCQKRFQDIEILPKFSETHVFRGTIRHPYHDQMYLTNGFHN